MKSLEKPIIDKSIFEKHINRMQSNNLQKPVLLAEVETLKREMVFYDEEAQKGLLKNFPIVKTSNNNFKDYMVSLYDNLFRESSDYDYLIDNVDICPYCFLGEATTIDHYLPKSVYPSLSITPINLVPACSKCNGKKNNKVPREGSELFHPYYMDEDFEYERLWLKANIAYYSDQVSFKFEIVQLNDMSLSIFKKIKYHFEILELYVRYSKRANGKFKDLKLKETYKTSKNFDDVRKELLKNIENTSLLWEKSMYQALHDDLQFKNWLDEQCFGLET